MSIIEIQLGPYTLKNRAVMAAMTRCRADPNKGVPTDLHVNYYSQRSEHAGLVITECSQVRFESNAFPGACGIYSDDQIDGWRKVTDKVHSVNGRIFLQIYHGGRACKQNYTGVKPVAPSSIAIRQVGKNNTAILQDQPEELKEDDIKVIVDQFKSGAENAMKAGFDGVQIHGANGYLIDEFLRDCSNLRNDSYGGNVENRSKFTLNIIDAIISAIGADKLGPKFSPCGRYNDMYDSNPLALYSYLLNELSKRKIAFVELFRGQEIGVPSFYNIKAEEQLYHTLKLLRPYYSGLLIGNGGFSFEEANQLIDDGTVDMVSFAKKFISNPDLTFRFANNYPLANLNIKYLYTGGEEGYTNYANYTA
jgi:N-ethylmaleimide reductase